MKSVEPGQTHGTEQPLVAEGGIATPPVSNRDPYEVLDDLMVVVEALCPRWPPRDIFQNRWRLAVVGRFRGVGSSKRGPDPSSDNWSQALRRRHVLSERQPHPMQLSSSRLNLCSSSIRRLSSTRHSAERRRQSAAVGVRPPGSEFIASRIVASGNPSRWATLITATRRNTPRS